MKPERLIRMRLMLEDIGEGTPRSGALKGQVVVRKRINLPSSGREHYISQRNVFLDAIWCFDAFPTREGTNTFV